MVNFLIILVAAAVVGLAARYIHKQKKQGVKCIGCPNGCNCSTCHCCTGASKEL